MQDSVKPSDPHVTGVPGGGRDAIFERGTSKKLPDLMRDVRSRPEKPEEPPDRAEAHSSEPERTPDRSQRERHAAFSNAAGA